MLASPPQMGHVIYLLLCIGAQRTVREDALLHILSRDNTEEMLTQLALAAESGDVSKLDAILASVKQAPSPLRRKCHPDAIRTLVRNHAVPVQTTVLECACLFPAAGQYDTAASIVLPWSLDVCSIAAQSWGIGALVS